MLFIFFNFFSDERREVFPHEGEKFANDLLCEFYETSAKLSRNVNEVFSRLSQLMLRTRSTGETKKNQMPDSFTKSRKNKKCQLL